LELKNQRDVLRSLSYQDGLTGIANRRRFDQFLDVEWRRGIRSKMSLSLVLMDIDYFKHFNDAEGHLAGDDCLKQIAQAVAGVMQRPGDLAARYGGEEFACILSETDLVGAQKVATRIQEAVASQALPHPRSSVSALVTLSMGVATVIPSMERTAESLIHEADEALYKAKRTGRNRILTAGA
jgi:diguanylate cyclase (GGDEF)-like protein